MAGETFHVIVNDFQCDKTAPRGYKTMLWLRQVATKNVLAVLDDGCVPISQSSIHGGLTSPCGRLCGNHPNCSSTVAAPGQVAALPREQGVGGSAFRGCRGPAGQDSPAPARVK